MTLSEWVEAFSRHLQQTKKVARNTLESYLRDIEGYLSYLEESGISHIGNTSQTEVQAYFSALEREGRARSTLARHLASLKAFYTFLWELKVVSSNPCYHVSLPKAVKTEPQTLTTDEINRLLNVPDPATLTGQRDQAMLELLYASGIRVTELVSLNVIDVNQKLGVLKCTGARGLERIIPLGQSALSSLDKYLSGTRPELLKTGQEPALFINLRGHRLTRQGFWKILKKCGDHCGLGDKITPNTLRHSFASHMLDRGADLRVVQELMGHADLATTQAYAGTNRARIKDTYLKCHPRA